MATWAWWWAAAWGAAPDPDAVAARVRELAEQGDRVEAAALARVGLRLRRAEVALDPADLARDLDFLGDLHRELGDLRAADVLLREGLRLRESAADPDPFDLAASLNNLAVLHFTLGDYATARRLLEQTLALMHATWPRGAEEATVLGNLAWILESEGDSLTARPLAEESLALRLALLGPDHPDVAEGRNNLALLLGIGNSIGLPEV